MIDEQRIREAVKDIQDPELKKSLLELGMIRDISVAGDLVKLTLALTTSKCPKKEAMVAKIRGVLEELPGISRVDVKLTTMSQEELGQLFPKHPLVGREKVRHVVGRFMVRTQEVFGLQIVNDDKTWTQGLHSRFNMGDLKVMSLDHVKNRVG